MTRIFLSLTLLVGLSNVAFGQPAPASEIAPGRELHSKVSATNANFKKMYDSLTSFSNNGYQWFQVAEVGYFMARHSRS